VIRSVPRVRLVSAGFLERQDGVIVDTSASVTLVEASGKRIVVDTGSPNECDKLLSGLTALSVEPNDVDIVVNTHLHMDHCGCNELFKRAVVYAHELESPPIGTIRVSGSMTLLPRIELVHTPGHTAGSITVFVRADRVYGICGDAIPTKANFDSHVPPLIAVNKRLALKSMDAIVSTAQIVIPGHGEPFEVRRKE